MKIYFILFLPQKMQVIVVAALSFCVRIYYTFSHLTNANAITLYYIYFKIKTYIYLLREMSVHFNKM